ncbi:MAG: hypothetical protein ACJAZ9_002094 [Neolewinella sp.]
MKVKSGVCPVDKAILHGEKFGDESAGFVEYVDGLIRVGGGPQSRKEVELFKAIHPDESLDALLKEFEVDWHGK